MTIRIHYSSSREFQHLQWNRTDITLLHRNITRPNQPGHGFQTALPALRRHIRRSSLFPTIVILQTNDIVLSQIGARLDLDHLEGNFAGIV